MKLQPTGKVATKLDELRAGTLAAIAEMDLKGTDSKVTQAMCIIEESFDTAAKGRKLIPKRLFTLGTAKAKLVASKQ